MVESLRELTEEQQKATDEICHDLDSGKFCARLLQGVTGSGKTEVYCQAMDKALDQGGGVLFLVPEVALAPQTVDRLRARFGRRGEQVVVWHSHLSAGEFRRLATVGERRGPDCGGCTLGGVCPGSKFTPGGGGRGT